MRPRSTIGLLTAGLGAWLLAACGTPPLPGAAAGEAATSSIYVVERGWHTDIALPKSEVHAPLAAIARDFPGARYLVFGFGDRRYLLTRRTGLADMLMALFPGPAAILVTGLPASPAQAFGASNVTRLAIPSKTLAKVTSFLWKDLAAAEQPRRIAVGPYPGSAFYAARGPYDALHTCNTWTAEALGAGGLPVNAAGVVFAGQVTAQLRGLAGGERVASGRLPYRQGGAVPSPQTTVVP